MYWWPQWKCHRYMNSNMLNFLFYSLLSDFLCPYRILYCINVLCYVWWSKAVTLFVLCVFVLWIFCAVAIISLLSAFLYLFILKFQVHSLPCIYLLALLNEGGRSSVLIVDTPAMKVRVPFGSHWGASFPYFSPHAWHWILCMLSVHVPVCYWLH